MFVGLDVYLPGKLKDSTGIHTSWNYEIVGHQFRVEKFIIEQMSQYFYY